jgi:hypothetical protein
MEDALLRSGANDPYHYCRLACAAIDNPSSGDITSQPSFSSDTVK